MAGIASGQLCLWLRGLLPSGDISIPEPAEPQAWVTGLASYTQKRYIPEAFIDGSGTSSDPRLRRIGWAVAWLNDPFADTSLVLGAAYGTCGEMQTVAYAELFALWQAFVISHEPMLIWCDCLFVVLGFHNKMWRLPACKHSTLWLCVEQEAANRSIDI